MAKLIKFDDVFVGFHCPGCKGPQQLPISGPKAWGFNNDFDKPTFSPSILTRWGQPCGETFVCHSFVRDGKIEFLSDCTHALAGKTVDLKDVQVFDDLFDEQAP